MRRTTWFVVLCLVCLSGALVTVWGAGEGSGTPAQASGPALEKLLGQNAVVDVRQVLRPTQRAHWGPESLAVLFRSPTNRVAGSRSLTREWSGTRLYAPVPKDLIRQAPTNTLTRPRGLRAIPASGLLRDLPLNRLDSRSSRRNLAPPQTLIEKLWQTIR